MHDLIESLKIHLPSRPIDSCIETLTQHIGDIDKILKPLLPSIPIYIKGTTHFLKILNNIDRLAEYAPLVTMDVSSLYSNIPQKESILGCKRFLNIRGFHEDYKQVISNIICFVLTHNNFRVKREQLYSC